MTTDYTPDTLHFNFGTPPVVKTYEHTVDDDIADGCALHVAAKGGWEKFVSPGVSQTVIEAARSIQTDAEAELLSAIQHSDEVFYGRPDS